MSGTRLFLGIDGGGTKTEFVCIDQDRTVRARTRTETTYHLQVGVETAIDRLAAGIGTICTMLDRTPADLDFVFFGLPAFGEDSRVDPILATACGTIVDHGRYVCDNDMVCGWAGSLACGDGLNIVAGTGSIGYGERGERRARVGGWGEVIGDEGSAYWIALRGLDGFARMSDGRLPKGPLHPIMTERLGLSTDLELCERVMGARAMPRTEVAALAPAVVDAARQGDAAATTILEAAATELVALANALHERLGYEAQDRANLSWSGGVLENVAEVREPFLRKLDETGRFRTVTPLLSPSVGAALYAMKISGNRHA